MGFVGLLKFSLKHLVLLAWPFCALGYPLCTSIRAIERKSGAEALNLITYWISFSGILLFEHAFNKLLEWLGIWRYLKLLIVLCLVTNGFVGSVYVYNHIFKPCLSLNLQTFIDWFNETKSSFSNKERFLTELDKYVNDNGTDALQNLLVTKGVNLGLATKDVKVITEVEQAEVSANSVDIFHSEDSVLADNFWNNRIEQQGGSWYCGMCGVHIESKSIISHLRGQEHTSMVQLLKENGVELRGARWRCTTCDFSASSKDALNTHLLGRKHVRRCRKSEGNG